MKAAIGCLKLLAFATLCLFIIPTQSAVLRFTTGPRAYVLTYFWQRMVCRIFGIKVQVNGTPYTGGQTLFMSNHISYLDIPAIASVVQHVSFVAKKDVASWPLFGFLSTLQQTAFISRSRGDAQKEANSLDAMLDAGKSLAIFPEGTSTDGQNVLPFKSSLFSIAFQDGRDDLMIQPLSVKVLKADGQTPKTQDQRDIYAWHRDMDTELPDHLWAFAKTSGAVIELTFHPPMPVREFEDRKTLAKACQEAVCNGVTLSHAA